MECIFWSPQNHTYFLDFIQGVNVGRSLQCHHILNLENQDKSHSQVYAPKCMENAQTSVIFGPWISPKHTKSTTQLWTHHTRYNNQQGSQKTLKERKYRILVTICFLKLDYYVFRLFRMVRYGVHNNNLATYLRNVYFKLELMQRKTYRRCLHQNDLIVLR